MKSGKGILYAFVMIAILGCLSGCTLKVKTSYIYQNGEKYMAGDREITEKIETINLDYMSGDVELTGTDSSVVTLCETSDKQLDDKRKVHTWVDGTTLYVRYCASAKGLDLNELNKHLVITVPKDVKLSDLKLEVSSGNVDCRDVLADSISMKASSGGISSDCTAVKYQMEASSGNIKLVQHGNSEEIKVNAFSGNIQIDMENADRVDAHASSGNIIIHADKIKMFNASLFSGTGKYYFTENPEETNIEASSGSQTVYLPKDADITATLEVSSGDLFYELAFSKADGKYVCGNGTNQLKMSTFSGDINLLILDEKK